MTNPQEAQGFFYKESTKKRLTQKKHILYVYLVNVLSLYPEQYKNKSGNN